jgi:hypothetical protein
LFITDVDSDTGEVKVEETRGFSAMRRGYERGMKLAEVRVEVGLDKAEALLRIVGMRSREVKAGEIRRAVQEAGVNVEVEKHIERILGKTMEEASGTEKSMETAGFIRGVLESYLVKTYMEAVGVSREVYELNAVSDKEALGVLESALFVAEKGVFANVESVRDFLKEVSGNLIGMPSGEMTAVGQKRQAIEFVNGLIQKFEQEGMITGESDRLPALRIAIAVIDDSLNKIMFSKIIERVKERAKVSAAALTRSVLSAA